MDIVATMYQKLADANPESYYSYTRRLDTVMAQSERARLAAEAWENFVSFINSSSRDELMEMREDMLAKREQFMAMGATFMPATKVLPLIDEVLSN